MDKDLLARIKHDLFEFDAEEDVEVNTASRPDYRDENPMAIFRAEGQSFTKGDEFENVAQRTDLPIETRMLNLENKFDNQAVGYIRTMAEALKDMQKEVEIIKTKAEQALAAVGIKDTGI